MTKNNLKLFALLFLFCGQLAAQSSITVNAPRGPLFAEDQFSVSWSGALENTVDIEILAFDRSTGVGVVSARTWIARGVTNYPPSSGQLNTITFDADLLGLQDEVYIRVYTNVFGNFGQSQAFSVVPCQVFTEVSAVGDVVGCNPNGTFDQEIEVIYRALPEAGDLLVMGQRFTPTIDPTGRAVRETLVVRGLEVIEDLYEIDIRFENYPDQCEYDLERSPHFDFFPSPGLITDVQLGARGECGDDLFEQDLIVSHTNMRTQSYLQVRANGVLVTEVLATESPQTIPNVLPLDAGSYDIEVTTRSTPGCGLTAPDLIVAPANINQVESGPITQCNADGSYDQEFVITHTNGDRANALIINGEIFPIEASPQRVTLENIDPNADFAVFSLQSEVTCDPVSVDLVAPAIVTGIALGDFKECVDGPFFFQDVVVFYQNAPGGVLTLSDGRGDERRVPITASPQTVELFFEISEEPYDITATINNSDCPLTAENLISSPALINTVIPLNVTACYADGTYDQNFAITLRNAGGAEFLIINGQQYAIDENNNRVFNVTGISSDDDFLVISVDGGPQCDPFRVELTSPHFAGQIEYLGGTCLDEAFAPILRITHSDDVEEGLFFQVNGQPFTYEGINPQIIELNAVARRAAPYDVTVIQSTLLDDCERVYPDLITQPFTESVEAGEGICNDDGTFDQELVITYANVPAGSTLVVNESRFPATGSPQAIILPGIPLEAGFPFDVLVSFQTPGGLLNDVIECAQTFEDGFQAPAACNLTVTDFILINAETDEEIVALADGAVIDMDLLGNPPITIRAITGPEEVGSVVLNLRGAFEHDQVESVDPYALFGDGPRFDYDGEVLPNGDYTLLATPFAGRAGRGDAGAPGIINFSIIRSGAAILADADRQLPFRAILVDADRDVDVVEIQDGDLIDMGVYGEGNYTIRYESTSDETQSVVLGLVGNRVDQQRTENQEPYALYGDGRGDYNGTLLFTGDHTFTATEYSQRNANGTIISTAQVSFTVRGAITIDGLPAARTESGVSIEETSDFSVYPVPAITNLHVKFPNEGSFSVAITDLSGRTISSGKYEDMSAIELDVRGLKDGVYVLKVWESLDKMKTVRFIKTR